MSKKVLITGAQGGIGSAIALSFRSAGYKVITTSTKKHLNLNDNRVVDFSDYKNFDKFLFEISRDDVDILINCAGVNYIDSILNYPIENFDNIININLRAPFRIIQTLLPNMIKKNWGRVINITSIFSSISKEYRSAYSASKFGLDGLTAAIAAEVAKYNILVNSVSPGFIETKLTRSILKDEEISDISSEIPMGRLGNPEEVAEFILWLCSDKNTYISGQNLIIDGGFVRV
jgi:3-oxoacyl-[acyl-carrier protein] reductase